MTMSVQGKANPPSSVLVYKPGPSHGGPGFRARSLTDMIQHFKPMSTGKISDLFVFIVLTQHSSEPIMDAREQNCPEEDLK